MKEITIKIPTKEDIVKWKDILLFKIRGGFKCKKCHKKTNFRKTHIRTTINDKPFMLMNHTPDICLSCTINELNEKSRTVFSIDHTCDWCNNHKKTTSFIKYDDVESFVTFGSQWWNGYYICQDCINEILLKNVEELSSKFKEINGRLYPVNELGLIIKK